MIIINIDSIYLELELYFNRKLFEDNIIEYSEYIEIEKKILKEIEK